MIDFQPEDRKQQRLVGGIATLIYAVSVLLLLLLLFLLLVLVLGLILILLLLLLQLGYPEILTGLVVVGIDAQGAFVVFDSFAVVAVTEGHVAEIVE